MCKFSLCFESIPIRNSTSDSYKDYFKATSTHMEHKGVGIYGALHGGRSEHSSWEGGGVENP